MARSDFINKMTAEEIRNKIKLYKKLWINLYTTNCYAYALGLDLPEKRICSHAYQPGVMSNYDFSVAIDDYFELNTLLDGILFDLEFLGIDYKEIKPSEIIGADEWKIALFISQVNRNNPLLLDDFHFLKYYPDGTWHHKFGYNMKVTNYDDNLKIITDPTNCHLDDLTYTTTLCLKLKK